MDVRKGLFCVLLLLAPAASGAGEDPPAPVCLGPSCHLSPPFPGSHPAAAGEECAACHRPAEDFSVDRHSLDSFDRSFSERLACLGCHDRVRRLAESSLLLHAPFREGPCTDCHAAHRAPFTPLLREAYPPSVYASFEREAYALCWGCHDSSLATDKFSVQATAFRLGRRNFHFSHLQKRKGMTCRACHLTHGSPQSILVRDVAPRDFPGWMDTMRFSKDSGGGRCEGGCHKEISYRR